LRFTCRAGTAPDTTATLRVKRGPTIFTDTGNSNQTPEGRVTRAPKLIARKIPSDCPKFIIQEYWGRVKIPWGERLAPLGIAAPEAEEGAKDHTPAENAECSAGSQFLRSTTEGGS
jgi:hypothetical protein